MTGGSVRRVLWNMPTACSRLSAARSAATSASMSTDRAAVDDPRRSRTAGHRGSTRARSSPGCSGSTVEPSVGIGQRALLVQTPGGNLLWDSTGYVDDDWSLPCRPPAEWPRSRPVTRTCSACRWSGRTASSGAPVYVAEADREWLQREDPAVRLWDEPVEVLPGVTLHRIGGHFPGSAVAHWSARTGRECCSAATPSPGTPGRALGVVHAQLSRTSVPMSAAVIEKVAAGCSRWTSTGSTTTSAARSSPTRRPGSVVRPTGTSPGCVETSTTSPAEQS